MKKMLLVSIIVITAGLALFLAGCGSKQAVTDSNTNNPGAGTSGQPALPLSMQLALGTLKLDGTDQAVTSEQAAELLPLWKAANSLSDADNVTPQELEGLFKQIQKAMTPEQMQSIQSMDLSGANMAEIATELGLELPAGAPSGAFEGAPGNLTEEQQATLEAARESGQMPRGEFGGGPPPGGMPGGGEGGFPPGGEPQEFSNNNNPAARQARRGSFGTAIYQAVIDLLEKKIQ